MKTRFSRYLVIPCLICNLSFSFLTHAESAQYPLAAVSAVNLDASSTIQTKQKSYINVKDYGAQGTGITDDTAAIQAAILAGYASGNGVNLYFPAGTYLMTSTIKMGNTPQTVGVPVRFFGDFRNSVIKAMAANVNPFLWEGPHPNDDGAGNRTGSVVVENIMFVGPGANTNNKSIALSFYGVQGITLRNTYASSLSDFA